MSVLATLGLLTATALIAQPQPAAVTERVSVSLRGAQGNGHTIRALPSPDGSLVAFLSAANNLVPRDRNRTADIFVRRQADGAMRRVVRRASTLDNPLFFDGRFLAFARLTDRHHLFVRDLQTGATTQLDLDASGRPMPLSVDPEPAFSDGAEQVTFTTFEPEHGSQIYLRDRVAGTTEPVSLSLAGAASRGSSSASAISADGRYVAFGSTTADLVAADGNALDDVFVRDRLLGTTTRVSVGSSGVEANGQSGSAGLSPDGRFVAFDSTATNLVPGDANGKPDVFVHDRATATTRRISVAPDGAEATGDSFGPRFAGPRLVQFASNATNLLPKDRNEHFDVLLHDLEKGTLVGSGVGPARTRRPARRRTTMPLEFSRDGRWVAFSASEDDFVRRDTNRRNDAFLHGPLLQPWTLPGER